jgi:hypothetical protein
VMMPIMCTSLVLNNRLCRKLAPPMASLGENFLGCENCPKQEKKNNENSNKMWQNVRSGVQDLWRMGQIRKASNFSLRLAQGLAGPPDAGATPRRGPSRLHPSEAAHLDMNTYKYMSS